MDNHTRVNPYQAPPLADDTNPARPLRWTWLPFVSLILAVLIEFLPTEADILFVLRDQGIFTLILAKASCLTIILAPLLVYFLWNGWKSIAIVRGKVLLIGLIVLLKLAMDLSFVVGSLAS